MNRQDQANIIFQAANPHWVENQRDGKVVVGGGFDLDPDFGLNETDLERLRNKHWSKCSYGRPTGQKLYFPHSANELKHLKYLEDETESQLNEIKDYIDYNNYLYFKEKQHSHEEIQHPSSIIDILIPKLSQQTPKAPANPPLGQTQFCSNVTFVCSVYFRDQTQFLLKIFELQIPVLFCSFY